MTTNQKPPSADREALQEIADYMLPVYTLLPAKASESLLAAAVAVEKWLPVPLNPAEASALKGLRDAIHAARAAEKGRYVPEDKVLYLREVAREALADVQEDTIALSPAKGGGQ